MLRCLLPIVLPVAAIAAPAKVDFNRDVRPILSETCFTCHGPDEKALKAKLRLDLRENAIHPAKSGAVAVVPGKADESEMIKRLLTTDEDDRMPPAKTGKSITPAQIEVLKRWINEGAEYAAHWSFLPLQSPPPPVIPAAATAQRNGIDAFIFSRLQQAGLQPSPEADKNTLIRRVTLDLTGLPPTPGEVAAFLADSSPQAYEKLVDRLLASPRFGERMTLEWLDAARFADTHGYHIDSARDMTRWRDWVIDAFNRNLPFDQFTVEQLAGDLLPNATEEQRIASGFNRNHMINFEGGAIPDEYHTAYVMDRVTTTSTVWLGLTMTCAQCHDHKYDPLTMKDFYSFYAFFNNVPENGLDGSKGNAVPILKTPRSDLAAEQKAADEEIAKVQANLDALAPKLAAAQAEWEKSALAQPPPWNLVRPESAKSAGGSTIKGQPDGSMLLSGTNPAQDSYAFTLRPASEQILGLRIEALADDSLAARGPGRAANGNFVMTGLDVSAAGKEIAITSAVADYSQNGFPISNVIDRDPASGWAVDGDKRHENRTAAFALASPIAAGQPVKIVLHFTSTYGQHAIGKVRLSVTSDPQAAAGQTGLSEELIAALKSTSRTEAQKRALAEHFRKNVSGQTTKLETQLTEAKKRRESLTAGEMTTMIMEEKPGLRETFMLDRGQYDKKTVKVVANTPASLPPMHADLPKNRLGLAKWLVSGENPLTARVIVNRYWQMYFGHGIVKSAENLGTQADWPTHPELLDWLASEFIRSKWDVKAMQRLIVTSATYRQSPTVRAEHLEKDPENRLLARAPRVRLPAEFIRDLALATSGLLNPKIGGSSVNPYQPAGLWEELMVREDGDKFSAQKFVQSKGPDLYRRGMYTFWKRTCPPANLGTLDAPDREVCSVRRPRTNTPLQALTLMNDVTFVEASRKLAERLLRDSKSDPDRLQIACQLVLSRPAKPTEAQLLLRLKDEQLAVYQKDPASATALLNTGDAPPDSSLSPAEIAAWSIVCSAILNLDEAVTRQ